MKLEGIVHEVIPSNRVAKILEEYRQLRLCVKAFLESNVDSDTNQSAVAKRFLS